MLVLVLVLVLLVLLTFLPRRQAPSVMVCNRPSLALPPALVAGRKERRKGPATERWC